jgi:regulator of sigma E protease
MLLTLLALAFVLGIAIIVHEFGHFIVAKKAGVFVKTFSVGFGKKMLKKRIGDTVYALSLIPFGGYVKFAGEAEGEEHSEAPQGNSADETPDSEIDPKRYFINQNVLVRGAVVFAGPFSNYLLAIVLYIAMFAIYGLQVTPSTRIGDVTAGSPADSVGLKVNDVIVSVDGQPVSNWGQVLNALVDNREKVKKLEVHRGDKVLTIDYKSKLEDNHIVLGFDRYVSNEIGQVKRDAPAYRAGMRPGATIDAINDTTITSYYDIERIIHEHPNEALVIRWSMNGTQHVDTITPEAKQVPKEGSETEFTIVGQIGVGPAYERERLGVLTSVKRGFETTNETAGKIISFIKLYFQRKLGVETLGGPILIGQMAGEMARWGFDYLVYFLAFLSINLGIFNLLPILPFDGGHLALFAYEGITRRRISKRFREIMAQAGFVLVILLMVFVVFNDIRRLFGSSPGLF